MMSTHAEVIMSEETEKPLFGEDSGNYRVVSFERRDLETEPFCEQTFSAAFRFAAKSDDPLHLATVSSMFSRYPSEAWACVDKICDEKAQEATLATQNGHFTAASEAIEEHHALAMVYSKLIAARLERLSAQL